MKKTSSLELEKLFIVFFALSAFIKMHPYFTWNVTGIIAVIYNFGLTFITLIIGLLVFEKKTTVRELICAIYIIAFGIYICVSSQHSISSIINIVVAYTLAAVFILQTTDIKARSFDLFYKIFAISLIPAVIYSILLFVGIDLPHSIIKPSNELKLALGHYYNVYPGAVFYVNNIKAFFCGMMDEPGVIGTFGALLLVARQMIGGWEVLKAKVTVYDVAIFIGGLLSQSKAFFVIIVFAIFFRLLMNKSLKGAIGLLIASLTVVFLLNIDTDYDPLVRIQTIVNLFSETGDIQLLRTTDNSDTGFNDFLNGPTKYILFGHGYMMSQQVKLFFGSAEVRMLIYDIGFIGVSLLLTWIVVATLGKGNRKTSILSWHWMFVFAFMLSIIQRQYITSLDYIVVLFGGCAYIEKCEAGYYQNRRL